MVKNIKDSSDDSIKEHAGTNLPNLDPTEYQKGSERKTTGAVASRSEDKQLHFTPLWDAKALGQTPDNNGANKESADRQIKSASIQPEVVTNGQQGKVEEAKKTPDLTEMAHTAEAIRKATGKDNWVMRWADSDAICNLLKNKSDAERLVIDDIYKQKYGVSLDKEMEFLSEANRDKFRNILNKKDGDINSQDACRIHEALLEHKNLFFGRSSETLDQDIRQTLSTKTYDQIQAMDKEYRTYGSSLREAIMNDPNISLKSKGLIDVYLKGNDKRTDEDTLKMAQIALQAKDAKCFEEVMKGAPESARKRFLDEGGEKQIQAAFATNQGWGTAAIAALFPSYQIKAGLDNAQAAKDVQHSLDLAKQGKIDTVTQINDNKGIINWTTNDKGVEAAIDSMTAEERSRYMLGQKIAGGDSESAKNLTAEKKQEATDYYNKLHSALTNAGNGTSVEKWEDMIQHQGGSLVSKLAAHRGNLWNDGAGKIASDIEDMNKSDWERLKPGTASYEPNYRGQIEDMLRSYNCSADAFERCSKILDEKQHASTFEEAQKVGRSSIVDALEDREHWYKDDTHGMLEAISKMTPAEQERYRLDATFKKQVDDKLVEAFDNSRPVALQTAQDVLAKVARGEKLNYDIVANLQGYASDFKTDHAQAVRDIEQAFKDEPKLRERINQPQTAADAVYADKFRSAAVAAIGGSDYEKYVQPLVETGHLDIGTKIQLDKGIFKNDQEGALKDILSSSPEELQRLQADTPYREKVISFLGAADKKVAENVISQGKLNPEDDVRQNIVHWGGSAQIMDKLRELAEHPELLDTARTNYANKYGSDLEGDLLKKLGGDDKQEATRILHNHETADERYNDSREQYYRSRSGMGSKCLDYIGQSGTGSQLDEAMANYRKELSEANKNHTQINPERQKALENLFQQTLKNFKESKSAAADHVVDGVIAGAAIGSLIVSGGASAPLLAIMAVGGGALKVGAKAAIMGGDYETTASSMSLDFAEGLVNGVTSVIGPGECAALLKIGQKAALQAAEATVKQLGEQGLKAILKEGGEEALQKGTAKIMQHALSSGAKNIEQKAIAELAEKSISNGLVGSAREKAVQELTQALSKNLSKEFEKETAHSLSNVAREVALNAGGGAMGAGAAGGFQGLVDWDPKISVEENLARVAQSAALSAATGAAMGGGMTVGMKALGHGWTGAKRLLAPAEAPKNLGAVESPSFRSKNMEVVKGEDGRYYHKSGERMVPVELGAQRGQFREQNPRITKVENGAKYGLGDQIQYHINGERFNLDEDAHGWFSPVSLPNRGTKGLGPVKVHVATENLDALRKIQQLLIPALEKDPQLRSDVLYWKTSDPYEARSGGTIPLEKQKAKGFTIYARTPEQAQSVLEHVDSLLADNGLSLDKPAVTGNVDNIRGDSNRVGIVRDVYTQSVDCKPGLLLVNLDKNLASNIEREFGKGLRLTDEQLRKVEKSTGLQEEILGYDSTGKLSMRVGRGSRSNYITNGVYVVESQAGRAPHATDRPALYQLYDRYHLDPIEQLNGAAKPAALLKPKLVEQASINGQKYDPGQIVTIGRGKDADVKVGAGTGGVVSRMHAKIFTNASGKTYIADLGSTNGTFINGKRMEPSIDPQQPPKWYRVASGDRVTLGTQYDLKLRQPGEILAAQKPPVTAALRQSNEFASKDQTSAPLKDGFQNAGQRNLINADGSFDKAVGVATVIDRGNDPILQQTMKDAERRFAGVNPPLERARQLSQFVRELLTPAGDSGGQLDKWYANFSKEHSGERALLGEFISSHRGGCTQQAMLYKVLADELFKDVPGVAISLVRGSTAADGVVDHAWVNVDFGNGPRIYDPRENITGKPTAQLPHYRIGGAKAEVQPLLPGAKIPWKGNNWVVEGFDRATGNVVVSHYGEKVVTLVDLMRDRQNVDKLVQNGSRFHAGDSYRVTRSNGAIEQWKVVSYDRTTGKVRLSSDRALTDQIPSGQLAALRRAS